MGQKPQLFTRQSSGLVRAMSPYSAFAYNVLNMGIIFPWVYQVTIAYWPDASVPLGIAITGGFTALLGVVYAGLASAMPRTGGDYVFQSRTLKPYIGFAIVSTMIITFFMQWQALAGWLTSILGLSPLFLGLGLSLSNPTFVAWGIWFNTPTGIFATTLVASTLAAMVLIKSFKLFVQAQWVMWYGFLLGFVVMVILFLTTSTSAFAAHFNNAANVISPGISNDFYHYVSQQAAQNGFTPASGFSFWSTLFVLPVALTSLGWVGYAQEQAGEIQGASRLKNQIIVNVGAGIFTTICMMILAYALINATGQGWLATASYDSLNGFGSLPFAPYFANFAALLTNNPILIFIMIFGVLLNAVQVVFNVIIGWTRVALAMSMDNLLPKLVGSVSSRTHTPIVAHIIVLIFGGGVMSYVFNFYPNYQLFTLSVTAVASIMYIGTAVGGAILPRVRREIYDSAPISKYKLAGIPVISICGIIAAVFCAWMFYDFITYPQLEGFTPLYAEITGGIFVGWLAYYGIRRAWLQRVGINLGLAFMEVPPA